MRVQNLVLIQTSGLASGFKLYCFYRAYIFAYSASFTFKRIYFISVSESEIASNLQRGSHFPQLIHSSDTTAIAPPIKSSVFKISGSSNI
jgi:hypothetical protein